MVSIKKEFTLCLHHWYYKEPQSQHMASQFMG